MAERDRIAIVGTGVSGLVGAYLLSRRHEVTVFESDSRLGGHTHTVDVDDPEGPVAIDTGFIVFNTRTYPNFCALMDRLGVASRATSMSFSVKCERTGLEYNGTTLNSLFAQRANLLRPRFYGMIRDILRFGRDCVRDAGPMGDITLGEYLRMNRYGDAFVRDYLVPMAGAIWSAPDRLVMEMQLRFFVRFFDNHGMLTVNDRPVWRVIEGGSRAYLPKLTAPFAQRVRLSTPVREIRRVDDGVLVRAGGGVEKFDHVLIACHSDQALAMLADPSETEKDILGAIAYQVNDVVLHTDERVMPRRRLAWAAWNSHIAREDRGRVGVTYSMNILQGLRTRRQYFVTLNRPDLVDPSRELRRFVYHHPQFDARSATAQRRHGEISGKRRTHYCGAYWGNGFHEDGVRSAIEACRAFGESL